MKAVAPDEYRVMWGIDIDLATNPTQAATQALLALCGGDSGLTKEILNASTALHFMVYDYEGNATEIDLAKEAK